ncbi:hypothetical protein [Streptomyces sp. NPDC055709]
MTTLKPGRLPLKLRRSTTRITTFDQTVLTLHLTCYAARLSWVLAAESPTRRGSPFASDRTCI